jgi:hypothetical protein
VRYGVPCAVRCSKCVAEGEQAGGQCEEVVVCDLCGYRQVVLVRCKMRGKVSICLFSDLGADVGQGWFHYLAMRVCLDGQN